MAELQGWPTIMIGDTTIVDATQMLPLGSVGRDKSGSVFVYSKGVASLDATHNWVSFNADWTPALLAAGAVGRVGVAMAVLSSATVTFGWYQVYGKNAIAGSDAVATNSKIYIDATAGRIDDAAVTGDALVGAWTRSTDSSTNICTVELNYPQVTTLVG